MRRRITVIAALGLGATVLSATALPAQASGHPQRSVASAPANAETTHVQATSSATAKKHGAAKHAKKHKATKKVAKPTTGIVRGYVTDHYSPTFAPLGGVTVDLDPARAGQKTRHVETNAKGMIRVTLPAGSYAITLHKTGYITRHVVKDVVAGTKNTRFIRSMKLLPGTVTGRAMATDGSPIAGASLQFSSKKIGSSGGEGSTAADGTFSVTLPPSDDWVFSVYPYLPSPYAPSATQVLDVVTQQTLTLPTVQLELGGTVTGTVTDPVGRPISTSVTIDQGGTSASGATDADGHYSIARLRSGTYTLTFAGNNYYQSHTQTVQITAGGSTTVDASLPYGRSASASR